MGMVSHQIENINKETKTIEKHQIKIMKLKTTISVMKKLPGRVQQQNWAGSIKDQRTERLDHW